MLLEKVPLFKLNLKLKIALLSSFLFVIAIFGMSAVILNQFDIYLNQNLIQQQDILVKRVARELDQRILLLQRSLRIVASNLPADALKHADSAQKYLDMQSETLSLFNRTLFLFNARGELVAETPFRLNRRGKNYYYRQYIQDTLKSKKPIISDPFLSSRGTNEVVLMFTMPILDHQNNIIGILSASIGLDSFNSLGELIHSKLGETGYVYVVNKSRVVLFHPEKNRIFSLHSLPGENLGLDRAITGQDGTFQSTDQNGHSFFSTFKKVPNTDWILVGVAPLSGLKQPLYNVMDALWEVTLFTVIGVLLSMWAIMTYMLTPLQSFNDQLKNIDRLIQTGLENFSQHDKNSLLLHIHSHDEIQKVADTFNHMMQQLINRENDVQSKEAFIRQVIDTSPNMVFVKDQKQRYIFANQAVIQYLETTSEQLFDTKYSLNDYLDNSLSHVEAHHHVLKTGEEIAIETQITKPSGEISHMLTVKKPLFQGDGQVNVLSVSTDITERKLAEKHIHHLATHDVLTNLPNRALFTDRVNYTLLQCAQNHGIFAILNLDLDRFKTINDTLGHSLGDKLLQAVAKRLISCLSFHDTVSRQGGDEFSIILGALKSVEEAGQIAGQLLQALSQPFYIEERELHIGGSIGISFYPEDAQDAMGLICNAEIAMYRAKERGRNKYEFYTQDMNEKALERLTLENNLRRAIEREEFLLYYQPKINLITGKVIGAEALIRWRHPEMGLIPPGKFIPLAEESGLILPMGEWTIKEACRQMKAWEREGLTQLKIAVNLSAAQFYQANLIQIIESSLKQVELDPQYFELEITESMMMHDPENVILLLHRLKDLQIHLSIDDFGTGYSSLSYLKRFPIDTLKVDQSFVRDLLNNEDDKAIVTALIAMAHSLGLNVIAEGVETAAQAEFLRQRQCNEVQGYYFSKPLPANEFKAFVAKNHEKY